MVTIHLPGERRRAIALASLLTLTIYLLVTGIVYWAGTSDIGRFLAKFLNLPLLEQGGLLGVIWLGSWLVAFAQHELIAHNEGGYSILLTISQVRGMRWLGLGSGGIILALLAVTYAFNTLTAPAAVTGLLAALTLVALGMPNAPTRRYTSLTAIEYTLPPEQQRQLGAGLPQRIVDADPRLH